MTITFAIYTVTFLLTAAIGVELGYWLARRKFTDVTEAYEDLRLANARSDLTQWNRLWKRLSSMPEPKETDLSEVNSKLESLERQLFGLSQRLDTFPEPKDTDLSIVYAQLNRVGQKLTTLCDDEPLRFADAGGEVDPLSDTDCLPILPNVQPT